MKHTKGLSMKQTNNYILFDVLQSLKHIKCLHSDIVVILFAFQDIWQMIKTNSLLFPPWRLPPSWSKGLLWWGSMQRHAVPGDESTPPASAESWSHQSRENLSCLLPTLLMPLGYGPMGSAHRLGYPPFCQSTACLWQLCRRTLSIAVGRRETVEGHYFSLPNSDREKVDRTVVEDWMNANK